MKSNDETASHLCGNSGSRSARFSIARRRNEQCARPHNDCLFISLQGFLINRRDDDEHLDGAGEDGDEDAEHHVAVPQYGPQAPLVEPVHAIEDAFHESRDTSLAVNRADAQEAAAEHRRQRDGDDTRDQNRGRDRDGELAEQPAENARS